VFKDAEFRAKLLRAPTAGEIFRIIAEEEQKYPS
jgi:mannitol/fructose-specific phosphotransferase system IIA component (Ntr-type)